MHYLFKDLYFPPVEEAHESGILAVGGDLSIERLLLAYSKGIFPWYSEGEPITWYAPDYRMVLPINSYKTKKSLRNILNRKIFTCTINQSFVEVMKNCKDVFRKDQDGTWISDEIIDAYTQLYQKGYALSVEVWQDGILVGGLYGVCVGKVFCGESMFSKVSNASKVGFDFLVKYLVEKDFKLIDGQVYNDYLEQLGFFEISRENFMKVFNVLKV
ncbi:leucyl/phenylalanyl-tRNA--protein transferase [Capnocytophaga sp. ARDL2]|uniref:leucyl/phenylalanyl-tRNA--protein transferase n=1 Tax=Capnocytophaga sp. ARDL2 TaxID=3238809 RepID=UPI0035579793